MSDLSERASWWSLTLNNPTEQDRQTIHGPAPRWLKMVKGQDEIGETGTLHIQMCLNTDQVRMSAIKGWLPRSHIVSATTQLHIQRLKNYVAKEETSVEGTQFEHKYREQEQHMTMADVMTRIAELAYADDEYNRLRTEKDDRGLPVRTTKELHEREFWDCANMLISADENLVALLTQPQYLRAWIHTRKVWIIKTRVDSQTSLTIENPRQNILVTGIANAS